MQPRIKKNDKNLHKNRPRDDPDVSDKDFEIAILNMLKNSEDNRDKKEETNGDSEQRDNSESTSNGDSGAENIISEMGKSKSTGDCRERICDLRYSSTKLSRGTQGLGENEKRAQVSDTLVQYQA